MNTFKHYIKSNKQNMETTILWADDEIGAKTTYFIA